MDNKEIIRLLIENKDKDFTILEISKILQKNYRIVYEAIKSLENSGTIKTKKIGNTKVPKLYNTTNELMLTELERRDSSIKNQNLSLIYHELKGIKNQFILLLFGSQAKKQNKNSDIDLLLISNEANEIQEKIDRLSLDIHLTHITYEEFEESIKTNEFNVVNEAIKNNIILFGIEDYYRLKDAIGGKD